MSTGEGYLYFAEKDVKELTAVDVWVRLVETGIMPSFKMMPQDPMIQALWVMLEGILRMANITTMSGSALPIMPTIPYIPPGGEYITSAPLLFMTKAGKLLRATGGAPCFSRPSARKSGGNKKADDDGASVGSVDFDDDSGDSDDSDGAGVLVQGSSRLQRLSTATKEEVRMFGGFAADTEDEDEDEDEDGNGSRAGAGAGDGRESGDDNSNVDAQTPNSPVPRPASANMGASPASLSPQAFAAAPPAAPAAILPSAPPAAPAAAPPSTPPAAPPAAPAATPPAAPPAAPAAAAARGTKRKRTKSKNITRKDRNSAIGRALNDLYARDHTSYHQAENRSNADGDNGGYDDRAHPVWSDVNIATGFIRTQRLDQFAEFVVHQGLHQAIATTCRYIAADFPRTGSIQTIGRRMFGGFSNKAVLLRNAFAIVVQRTIIPERGMSNLALSFSAVHWSERIDDRLRDASKDLYQIYSSY